MIEKTKNSILKRWAQGIFKVKKAVVGLYIIGGFILLSIVSRAFFDLGVTDFNLITWLGL